MVLAACNLQEYLRGRVLLSFLGEGRAWLSYAHRWGELDEGLAQALRRSLLTDQRDAGADARMLVGPIQVVAVEQVSSNS